MKLVLNIEQYNNGISLKWEDTERLETEAIVALDRDKESSIGKVIWGVIKAVMDMYTVNTVRMEITYTPIKEDEP